MDISKPFTKAEHETLFKKQVFVVAMQTTYFNKVFEIGRAHV